MNDPVTPGLFYAMNSAFLPHLLISLSLVGTAASASTACLQSLAISPQGHPIPNCQSGDPSCLVQPPIVLFLVYPRSALTRFFSQGLTVSQVGMALLPSVSSPSLDGGRVAYRCEATNVKAGLFRCLESQNPSVGPIFGKVSVEGLPSITPFSRISHWIYRPDDLTPLKNQYVCNTRLASVQAQSFAFGPVVRSIPSPDTRTTVREHTSDFVMRVELLDYKLSSFHARDQKPTKRFGWSIDPNAIAPLIRNLF